MKIKTMAFREVYKLFVDVWELYRKYGARRLDDAECEIGRASCRERV